LTVYQPQVETWDQVMLTARAAVAVERVGGASPEYGVITFSARTLVDKEAGMVTLSDITISGGSFPSAADQGAAYVQALRTQFSAGSVPIELGRLETSLAIARATEKTQGQPVENQPPRIIYSDHPAVLVLVDGPPALRNFGGTGFMRVINTRALILLDQQSGKYSLRLLGGWMQADALEGPWAYQAAPANLDAALAEAKGEQGIDLMDAAEGTKYTAAQVSVYVSTGPAELVQTDGTPDFAPIPGTQILYAQDTESQLFLYTPEQRFYFLVSGRWFRSPSLANGPWEYVDQSKLPADFAKIPEAHPTGGALASVAGTAQAAEAVISNSIPQTAEIQRSGPSPDVQWDGAPKFEAIPDTTLQGSVNTTTPVICTSPNQYYCVENAVWFSGPSPAGPWVVATQVPSVIYTIPVQSRFHYVTYVRVYSYSPESVVVGYTPGYYGTVIAPSGCVVYGTGFRYVPYCGAFWVPPPCTYGWGACFSVGYRTGFAFGFTGGWYVGAWTRPYWGGFGYHFARTNFRVISFNHFNSFHHWDQHVVANDVRPVRTVVRPAARMPNNVAAGRDGRVYRRGETGAVERRDDGQWHALDPARERERSTEINRVLESRGHGEERAREAQPGQHPTPGGEFRRPAPGPAGSPAPGPGRPAPPPRGRDGHG
jgi:hypothetical protein